MKLETKKDDVFCENESFKSEEMTIRSQDMHIVINILRAKMYSNPIRTITQELMSNARDAQRELGNGDEPIFVKLPSQFDPTFSVTDYGVGISPDRMWDVFINYGASTKRDSNHQTGGFGLGAKSPFSYTDQFTITSITPDENGNLFTRQYIAVIKGESGFVEEVFSRPAEIGERRGTTISFAVKTNDILDFERFVLKTCKHWDVHPLIKGVSKKTIEDNKSFDWIASGKGWNISKNVMYRQSGQAFAIVDGIEYPLRFESITKFVSEKDTNLLSSVLNNNINLNIFLYFDVGEVNLTANREELDYSGSKTVNQIVKRLNQLVDEIKTNLDKKMSSCKEIFEAYGIWWHTLHQDNLSKLIPDYSWDGHVLKADIFYNLFGRMYGRDSVTQLFEQKRSPSFYSMETIFINSEKFFNREEYLICFSETSHSISESRLKVLSQKYPKAKYICFIDFSIHKNQRRYRYVFTKKDFLDKIDNKNIDWIDLKDVPTARSYFKGQNVSAQKNYKKQKHKIRFLNKNTFSSYKNAIHGTVDFDQIDKKSYYVIANNKNFELPNFEYVNEQGNVERMWNNNSFAINLSTLSYYVHLYTNSDKNNYSNKVYALLPSQLKYLNKNFISFGEFIYNKYKDELKDKVCIENIIYESNTSEYYVKKNLLSIKNKLKEENYTGLFDDIINKYLDFISCKEKIHDGKHFRLNHRTNYLKTAFRLEPKKVVIDLKKKYELFTESIKKYYPLLYALILCKQLYFDKSLFNDVFEYIKNVDLINENEKVNV